MATPRVHIPVDGIDLKSYISNIEINIIQEALEKSGGVIAHAAKSLVVFVHQFRSKRRGEETLIFYLVYQKGKSNRI